MHSRDVIAIFVFIILNLLLEIPDLGLKNRFYLIDENEGKNFWFELELKHMNIYNQIEFITFYRA